MCNNFKVPAPASYAEKRIILWTKTHNDNQSSSKKLTLSCFQIQIKVSSREKKRKKKTKRQAKVIHTSPLNCALLQNCISKWKSLIKIHCLCNLSVHFQILHRFFHQEQTGEMAQNLFLTFFSESFHMIGTSILDAGY